MYERTVLSTQKHATYHTVQIVESYCDRAKSKHSSTLTAETADSL
jgi:hypothetical protein